jgi:hypothetical protein
LGDPANTALLRGQRVSRFAEQPGPDCDVSGIDGEEPCDGQQHCGLPAPRGAQDGHNTARGHHQRHVSKGSGGAVGDANLVEGECAHRWTSFSARTPDNSMAGIAATANKEAA